MGGWGKVLHFDLSLRDSYDKAFVYLLVASLVLRGIWLDVPAGSLIFDER